MNTKKGFLLLECLISLIIIALTVEMLLTTAKLYAGVREYEEEQFELSWEQPH